MPADPLSRTPGHVFATSGPRTARSKRAGMIFPHPRRPPPLQEPPVTEWIAPVPGTPCTAYLGCSQSGCPRANLTNATRAAKTGEARGYLPRRNLENFRVSNVSVTTTRAGHSRPSLAVNRMFPDDFPDDCRLPSSSPQPPRDHRAYQRSPRDRTEALKRFPHGYALAMQHTPHDAHPCVLPHGDDAGTFRGHA